MENNEDMTNEELEQSAKMGSFIRGSFKYKAAYRYMRFLMVLEGIVWSIMDMLRAHRMNIAARINRNYKDRV